MFFCIFTIETVINLQDEEGFTPLMWAAAHGQIAVVEFLLQNVQKNELLMDRQNFVRTCPLCLLTCHLNNSST